VLNQLVHAVRATGRLGVVGLYVPSDPGAPNGDAAEGKLLFEIGKFFEKGQTMGAGQAGVKSDNRQLRDLIIAGKVEPRFRTALLVVVARHPPPAFPCSAGEVVGRRR
jgi:glutathione-independent formaldehyde dehydrogenase